MHEVLKIHVCLFLREREICSRFQFTRILWVRSDDRKYSTSKGNGSRNFLFAQALSIAIAVLSGALRLQTALVITAAHFKTDFTLTIAY